MTEEEEFFAWLDGELDAETATRIEARVAASPKLSASATEHRRLKAGLAAAFSPIMGAEPAPPEFSPAPAIDFGARAADREERQSRFSLPHWAAMAATLALGLLVGNLVSRDNGSPVTVDDGRLVAAASLERALDTQLASTPAVAGVRIGLTFRDAQARICRSYSDASASGLACRDGTDWRIRELFQNDAQSSEYRMAAGQNPRLAEVIDQTIAGEPFDAREELEARDRGWR